jgi:hypothetical protein
MPISGSLTVNLSTLVNNCYGGDNFTFELLSEFQPASQNWTGSLSVGSLTIEIQPTLIGGYPYATSSAEYGNFVFSIQPPNIIIINTSLSSFDESYMQIPYFLSGSSDSQVAISSSLYDLYGDINYAFAPRFADKIVIRSYDGRTQVLDILSTATNNSQLELSVIPNLSEYFQNNPNQISELLIIKKVKDEQNIIMSFKKSPGDTSYGFVIPENISLDIVDNISSIQSNVQNQLLSTQQNSG